MIVPFQKDPALLADLHALNGDVSGLHLWWLGQSGYLIQCEGARMLVDPYLSDSLTLKYAQTDKPHVRMTERCIDPALLTGTPLVLSSHQHTDHFDETTLRALALANPGFTLIVPAGVEAQAKQRLAETDVQWQTLDSGQSLVLHGWTLTGIAAAHNAVERDDAGHCKFLGFVIQRGGFTLYHSGDTLLHPDLASSLRPFAPDIALVPINGNKPERRVAGNLSPQEAAQLCREIGAGLGVPHHYEMFEFNTADPQDFVNACAAVGQAHRVLRCGERLSLA